MRLTAFALPSALLVAVLVAVAVTLVAAEKPTTEYQNAMKDIGAAVAALSKPGAAEDFDAAKAHAAKAKDAFALVQKFWTARDAAAARLA